MLTLMSKTQLHIKDSGGIGTPIVMIHGFPLTHESFTNQFEALVGAGCRAVAYDRRGFGRSSKPPFGYDYDTLADDLEGLLASLGLAKVVLLGFSMGGGEVARYVSRHGTSRLSGVVFASAVTPFLLKTADNPDGPLTQDLANEKLTSLKAFRDKYFESFVHKFYEVRGQIVVEQSEIEKALRLCRQSDQSAAIQCMQAFSNTDFRNDLDCVDVPTLVIHGDSDAVVPFEGSGKLTAQLIKQAELHLIPDGPHGINVSHTGQFNRRILSFIRSCETGK